MRQVCHKLIAIGFWVLLAGLWIKLVAQHKAGAANLAYSVQYLSVVTGAVLAVTTWWIRHNTRIYRRKGPRTGRPEHAARVDEDRLGRPVRWNVDDGPDGAQHAGHLLVDLDGDVKVYRRAA